MVLYLIEDAFPRGFYSDPAFLWAVPAILFLFLGRIWLTSQRGELRDDPVAFALKDKISLLLGALMVVSFAAALFSPVQLMTFFPRDDALILGPCHPAEAAGCLSALPGGLAKTPIRLLERFCQSAYGVPTAIAL